MKKLLALGTILGAAALLQNKSRRDRLMSQGKSLLDSLKRKASVATDQTLFTDAELARTASSPDYAPPTPRGNGIY